MLFKNYYVVANRYLNFCHYGNIRYKSGGTSSNAWIGRQNRDLYVKLADRDGYRCRSAYKLIQIDDKFQFLTPGKYVIDCGAAPGSWSQVAVQRVNALGTDSNKPRGRVIGVDLQAIQPLEGAQFLPYCDFTQESTQNRIRELLNGRKADIVLSDMAPSASGVKVHNHEEIISLCFSVLFFSLQVLKPGGNLVCKLWMGGGQERLQNAIKTVFQNAQTVKPHSSRADSAEIFFFAEGFKKIEKS